MQHVATIAQKMMQPMIDTLPYRTDDELLTIFNGLYEEAITMELEDLLSNIDGMIVDYNDLEGFTDDPKFFNTYTTGMIKMLIRGLTE